jgi:hypothetical protein
MDILGFIKGELLEIIEFNDDSRDTLSWRFPDEDKAIKKIIGDRNNRNILAVVDLLGILK